MTSAYEGTTEQETDALARALRRHDPEVIDLLIERYQFRLLRYLLTLAQNRQAAAGDRACRLPPLSELRRFHFNP